jgi:hypothetical protein
MSKDHCLFVFFLTLSHCLYVYYPRTTVCLFCSLPCRTVFTDCLCVLSEDHSLFVLFALPLQICLSVPSEDHSLFVLFLTLSHCLYRLFKCTTIISFMYDANSQHRMKSPSRSLEIWVSCQNILDSNSTAIQSLQNHTNLLRISQNKISIAFTRSNISSVQFHNSANAT